MEYKELFKEDNEAVKERYDLVMGRIRAILTEETVSESFRRYFNHAAEFILLTHETAGAVMKGKLRSMPLEELSALNAGLYKDLYVDYTNSYLNPEYAVKILGDYGKILSFLYSEIQGMIVYAFESRFTDMTVVAELFVEIYNMFEQEELPEVHQIKDAVYWYISDYSEITMEYNMREKFDPRMDFLKKIVMTADLEDPRYLYFYGEYIGEDELKMAQFLGKMPDEKLQLIADTFVDGYIRGFENARIDLSVKKSVVVRACIGFEQVLRRAIERFESMGLTVILHRVPVNSVNKRSARVGFGSISVNRQYDFDHRFDRALYMDKSLVQRKLEVLKSCYEKYKKEVSEYAGPACLEVFGETPFEPVNKDSCYRLSEKQQKLDIQYTTQSMLLSQDYMDYSTTSFTIIAFPIPEIGSRFEEIFEETVRVNTLDVALYTRIQQTIIDILDQGEFVRILGRGDNRTDMTVHTYPLEDVQKQTSFENCVADVNIPAGEVFTSPVLEGTHGILHVPGIYLNDIQYRDLELVFKNGRIVEYSCKNFGDHEKDKALVRQNLMFNHDTLPLGEFAIGTNTTAYVMAEKFGITQRLPILIVEKMGPHFAVGDTCYSRSEDHKLFNPDGKEIVARDNEVSLLRKSVPDKAYYNCHTDITIPYNEIGEISVVMKDGTRKLIIQNGRFVLQGTDELNAPFSDIFGEC